VARLAGKFALVTGAAHGIGAEIARVLAGEGAAVVAADIDRQGADGVAAEIVAGGGQARSIELDVAEQSAWQAAADSVAANEGGLDILVNNAGIVRVGRLEDLPLADLEHICRVNLIGGFLAIQHMLPLMKARAAASAAGGSIINISSAVGIKAYPFGAAYSMTKGGLRLLSKSAAVEFALLGYNIRVNSIHPGLVETPMLAQEIERHAVLGTLGKDPAEVRRAFERMAPVGRFGQPGEIARAVLFLASDDSAFMTGAELVVDGGDTAS